jgi:hypothetical protein
MVSFSDEVTNYGYIGSVVGGYLNAIYGIDNANGNAVDYENPFGHAAQVIVGGTLLPNSNPGTVQFRDSANLPSDGASRISLAGSNWNRSNRLHPCYYIARILNGGTLASSTVTFFLEQRPSWHLSDGAGAPNGTIRSYGLETLFPQEVAPSIKASMALARVQGFQDGQTWEQGTNGWTPITDLTVFPNQLPSQRSTDRRIRTNATFQINEEYYGVVQSALLMIFSNKSNAIPLYYLDMLAKWPTATAPRIAGVAVDAAMNLWVQAESGELAFIDFSVSGGQVTIKNSGATSLIAADEAYGGLTLIGTTLYALVGTSSPNPYEPSTTSTYGIAAFNTLTNTWTSRVNSPHPGRHGGNTLRSMAPMTDGKIAVVVEDAYAGVTPWGGMGIAGSNVGPGGTDWPTSLAMGNTFIAYLPTASLAGSDDIPHGTLPRFKINIRAQSGDVSVVVKKVANTTKGYTGTGVLFANSVPVLFGGSAVLTCPSGGFATHTSDWINLEWDPANYDYYVYVVALTPIVTIPGSGGLGILAAGDHRTDTTSVAVSTAFSYNPLVGVFNDVDPWEGVMNTGHANWQLGVFDTTLGTWNANLLNNTTGAFATGNFNAAPLVGVNNPSQHYVNYNMALGALFEVSAGRLFIQPSLCNNVLFVADLTASVATLDDATVWVDLSRPGYTNLIPGVTNNNWHNNSYAVDFIQSCRDKSVTGILVGAGGNAHEGGYTILYAHPTFPWDGSKQLQPLYPNARSGNGGSATIDVSQSYYPCRISTRNGYGATFWDRTFPTSMADTQFTLMSVDNQMAGGWVPVASLTSHGTNYLPRYFHYYGGAWVPSADWNEALANPYLVPTAPDTPVAGPHGLVFNFGPTTNTTFLTNEFHTINVCYGQSKFARRSRWDFTMFAGRTFHNIESRTMADINTLQPHFVPLPFTQAMTFSGPRNPNQIAPLPLAWAWSQADGVNKIISNDDPAVITYDLSTVIGSRKLTPAAVLNSPNFVNGYSSSNEFTTIDLGAGNAQVVKSYAFNRSSQGSSRAIGNWKLQGSDDNSGWTDLDYVQNVTWPGNWNGSQNPRNWATRDVSANTTAYRYYRLLLMAEGAGYVVIPEFNVYNTPLGAANFADIFIGWNRQTLDNPFLQPFVYGTKFEVNTNPAPDTAGFVEITPKFRAHNGIFYTFDRQTNVQQLRITTQGGAWWDNNTRFMPPIGLWDYASTSTMNTNRMGDSGAANNTQTRGSWDSQCFGMATTSTNLWVDSNSPTQYRPELLDKENSYWGWFWNDDFPAAGTFRQHPFYGFITMPYSAPGTTVHVAYAWGRRS